MQNHNHDVAGVGIGLFGAEGEREKEHKTWLAMMWSGMGWVEGKREHRTQHDNVDCYFW